MLPEERREMALLLSSPQFNSGSNAKELEQLYHIILDAEPDFSDNLLNKEKAYFQIFSGDKRVPGKLEKIMADLNKLLRTMLLSKRYFGEENEDQQQLDWLALLRERGLGDRSKQMLAKLKNQKEEKKEESLEHYSRLLALYKEEHEWESTYNQFNNDLKIPNLIYHLDLYFFNYRKELENRYLSQKKAAQLPDLELAEISASRYQNESILLKLSNCVNDLLVKEAPTVGEFQALVELLKQHEEVLDFQALAQFYTFLRNSCTLLINTGYIEFSPLLHEIQKDNLNRGLFFQNGEITPNVYINLIQIALRVKEYTWAKAFIEQYKNRIIGGDKDQFFYRFNMANCYFAEMKYDEALDFLPEAASYSYYHHIIRRLELKIYYELRSDLLHFKMFAFRKYVERTAPKAIAANLRTMDLNFLNLLLQLSQSPLKDKKRSAKLVERIQKKQLLSDRTWLLEKARELG